MTNSERLNLKDIQLTRADVEQFAEQVNMWAQTLDQRSEAMLVDLLAKAGGDIYGHDEANAMSDGDHSASSSELSPLELRDFGRAVLGIFAVERPAAG